MFSRDDISFDEEIRREREGIPAKEFEVVRKLGTGSYAVVYLVREVLSRKTMLVPSSTLSSEDGHGVAAVGRMDMSDDGLVREEEDRIYGQEYAIKVLSKANLDQEALDAQLFEVRRILLFHGVERHMNVDDPFYRLPSIRHFALIQTSLHCTVRSKRHRSYFYCWSLFLEKTCSISWSSRVITSRLLHLRVLPLHHLRPPARELLQAPPALATRLQRLRFCRPFTPLTCCLKLA